MSEGGNVVRKGYEGLPEDATGLEDGGRVFGSGGETLDEGVRGFDEGWEWQPRDS